ncbi:squalene synthase HpnC [Rhodovibrio salinarum]|uniref:Squalene synthase HpnC n=1 Tax=Rhodovibrio salinarum TaxID=1087 RepID=A0A934QKW2_9PROT|nr:squalene synthase HpnC [Rhodovibrio salinarum]MBK1698612.1 squalene synthase HpnC [Rhodovibrio salinarum]
MSAIETPSGKGSGDENFPVASRLIAPGLRPHVMAYYAFARAADDIADNPTLAPDDKIARLDRLGAALNGEAGGYAVPVAQRLRASLLETGVPLADALDLLTAFKQDAVKTRYADWEELLGYCVNSANPVGRFLLDLHGEPAAARPLSDALCTALQILNHLQDLGDDYRRLDRVYLPESWLAHEGIGVDALAGSQSDLRLRRVIDRALDGVAALLPAARALPDRLTDRRMAMEAGAIAALARALHARLSRQDPLAVRVELSKPAKLWIAGRGALAAAWRPTPASETA